MKKYAILFFLALIVLACGGGEDTPSEAPVVIKKKAAKPDINVKKLWKINCIACHGLYGDMGTNGAANLQESQRDLNYRINIIKKGSENGVMTPFEDILNEEEITALAEYTMSMKKE